MKLRAQREALMLLIWFSSSEDVDGPVKSNSLNDEENWIALDEGV